ncbi:MAG TPA: hypothetical protein VMA95_14045 [Streptosporangiaceae bacterium]|nr:hypothetical protein [Streptosporangiaceae bacterium]
MRTGWPGSGDSLAAELVSGNKAELAFWTPGGFIPDVAPVKPDQDPTNRILG